MEKDVKNLPDKSNKVITAIEQLYKEFEQRKLMKKKTIKELLK